MAECLTYEQIQAQLRGASFGGVAFQVDNSSETYGHRVVIHEFPCRDFPYNESLGAKARKISINGYFAGDDWLSARDAMMRVAESGSAKTLRHPFYTRSIRAKCITFSANEKRDDLGRVTFSLELVEERGGAGTFGLPFLGHLVETAANAFVGAAVGSFNSNFISGNISDSVRSASEFEVREWAENFNESRLLTLVSDGAAIAESVSNLAGAAADIVNTGTIGSEVYDVFNSFRAGALDAASGASGLARAIYNGVDLIESNSLSPSAINRAKNAITVNKLFRRTAGALWSEFQTSRDFASRQAASLARNEVVAWFDSEFQQVDPVTEPLVFEELDRFRARCIEDITRKATDTAPVITTRFPRTLPSLAIATRIYADPLRAEEVFLRNRAAHPTFLGPEVEVLAR